MTDELRGKRILLVEDDDLVAMTVEDILVYAEATVEIAPRVEKALEALGARDFDVAIVDINLNGQPSWPVATELRLRGIPYLTVTGYGDMVDHELVGTLLAKPYSMGGLLTALSGLLGRSQ
ncbi:MAG: response regulator [Lysobacteraceae bacterium]|nr:MAG: response regulator [Xanthomonadaceae bacterium]